MNLLALVQDLARQSGTLAGGTTIASVVGVSGRADKLVNWIGSAWEDIQNQRRWNWLRGEFEGNIAAGTARYTSTALGAVRFSEWAGDTRTYQPMSLYDPVIGRSDEQPLTEISYETWRVRYARSTHDAQRPREWAASPSGELCLGPTPDKPYKLVGEFWKSPQTMTVDADLPECPAQYHKAIVYRAMELMAAADESIPTLQFAKAEYQRIFAAMVHKCLPSVSMNAGALA